MDNSLCNIGLCNISYNDNGFYICIFEISMQVERIIEINLEYNKLWYLRNWKEFKYLGYCCINTRLKITWNGRR